MTASVTKQMPAATLATLQKRFKCVRMLLTIATATPQYWNDGPLKELDSGNTYLPRGFAVDGLTWGSLDQAGARIVIENRDSVISNASYSGFLTGRFLTVGILVKDAWPDDWEAVYEPISAEISDVSGSAHNATLLLSGLTGLQRRSILRQGEKYCRHVYKGRRCQYAGVETGCDRTFATCDGYGNAVHFGGKRWALEPGAVIQISETGNQQLPGTRSSGQWSGGAANDDEDDPNERYYTGFGVGPDNVYDGPIDSPSIPGQIEGGGG